MNVLKVRVSGEQAAPWQPRSWLVLGYVSPGQVTPTCGASVFLPIPKHQGVGVGGHRIDRSWLTLLLEVGCSGTNSHFDSNPLGFTFHLHHLLPVWPWAQQASTLNFVSSHLETGVFNAGPLLPWELAGGRSKSSVGRKVHLVSPQERCCSLPQGRAQTNH